MTRRVRTIAVAAAALTVLAVSGCTQSTVGNVYTPGEGADADNDQIGLRNVLVVSDGRLVSALAGGIINKTATPDTVTSVAVQTPSGQTVPLTTGAIEVAPRGGVYFGGREPGDERRPAIRLRTPAQPGDFVTLVFSFSKAGDLTVQTPVITPRGEYTQTLLESTPKPLVSALRGTPVPTTPEG